MAIAWQSRSNHAAITQQSDSNQIAITGELHGKTLHAASVYMVVHSHFSYVTAGDASAQRVRDAFAVGFGRPRPASRPAWRWLLPVLDRVGHRLPLIATECH